MGGVANEDRPADVPWIGQGHGLQAAIAYLPRRRRQLPYQFAGEGGDISDQPE